MDAHRIIPASAGQTADCSSIAQSVTDHPRECGANAAACVGISVVCGSSPRVRGKLVDAYACITAMRIIPASAGQTAPEKIMGILMEDHPRECGANAMSRF